MKKYFLGVLLVSVILIAGCGKEKVLETSKEETLEVVEAEKHVAENEPENESEDKKNAEIQFPVILEDGKIEIESLFQYDGINPDCNNQEGKEIASIVFKNKSDSYLKKATIEVVFDDGVTHKFLVNDLPSGKSAMAFSIENSTLSSVSNCTAVNVETIFEENVTIEGLQVFADGMEITLENISDKDMVGIEIYCRNVFDENYFGGIAYKYTIEKISAGECTTITAVDCILGIADVVRIVVNE